MAAPTPPRFTVTGHAPHAKAATNWLIHDIQGDPVQIASCLDRTEARAIAVLLSKHADEFNQILDRLDPHRGAF